MTFAKLCAVVDYRINGIWKLRVRRWLGLSRQQRHLVRARIIYKYAKSFLLDLNEINDGPVVHDDASEKIFTIWQQGEENAPELVKACFRSIRKNCKQELVVLDDNNLSEYIQLPSYVMEKYHAGKIGRAHFADICRVELLYKYGGYWADATDFFTQPIPDWVKKHDFFMFLTGENTGSPYSFCQNCFIHACRGAYLLAAWRAMIHRYWRENDKPMDYFVHQLLFKTMVENDPRAKKYFEMMAHVAQDNTHILWRDFALAPFDEKLFAELTGHMDGFFQKTTYRDEAKSVPGCFIDAMINMNK